MKKQNEVHDKPKCGAKTRSSGGHPCRLPAGWGTDHPGEGRCKLHGGKSTGPKKHNNYKNAEKHGLFTKYIPEETMEIINKLETLDSLEMLWDNIKIQYAAIIRAQTIMEVKGKEDLVKEIKRMRDSGNEVEFEIQFAWDRYERFLNSQARAMTNLTNMIFKYEDLCKSEMATEEQRARIEKLKVETERVKSDIKTGYNTEDALKEYFEALGKAVKDDGFA